MDLRVGGSGKKTVSGAFEGQFKKDLKRGSVTSRWI
jgi:hypothetical protein